METVDSLNQILKYSRSSIHDNIDEMFKYNVPYSALLLKIHFSFKTLLQVSSQSFWAFVYLKHFEPIIMKI